MEKTSHRYDTNRTRPRHDYEYVLNIKCYFVWCLYVFSNTKATSEAEFMKKLSNTETELKKALLIKKTVQYAQTNRK